MSQKMFSVGIARFPTVVPGMFMSECPQIGDCLLKLGRWSCQEDVQIERIMGHVFAGQGIDAQRNKATEWALYNNLDYLIMIDADNQPDFNFFPSAWNHLMTNRDKGPIFIGSSYLAVKEGVGEESVVYQWESPISCHEDDQFRFLQVMSKRQCYDKGGLVPCAAMGTGVCIVDTRAFIIHSPLLQRMWNREITPGTPHDQPVWLNKWDPSHTRIVSTEDVEFTSWLSVYGNDKGYDAVLADFTHWAGHFKPLLLSRPVPIDPSGVGKSLYKHIIKENGKVTELSSSTGSVCEVSPQLKEKICANA